MPGRFSSEGGILRTVLPGSSFFLSCPRDVDNGFEEVHRLIIGRESFSMQGYPGQELPMDPVAECFSESFMQDLAGNRFSGPVVGALLDCILQSLPWTRVPKAPSAVESSLSQALSALQYRRSSSAPAD